MPDIKTILVTTDFSDTSKLAFAHAETLARKFGSRIVVAYVEEDRLPPLIVEYTAVGIEQIVERQEARAAEELEELVGELLGDELETEIEVTSGIPHLEIVRIAEERGADLIVMATHGRGFITHALLGSTTERVVRRAPCPVLVVRDTSSH